MAKKKQDTKGLAGIINKVPREIDINGQLHMLAWITPKEGKTLKDLGGAGQPGPMGIPAYFDVGEGAGGYDSGGTGDDKAADTAGGRGDPDAPDRGSSQAGDTSTSDDETDDPDTRGDVSGSYRGSVGTGFGSYKGGAYEGDTGRKGRSFADTSYAFENRGKDRLYGGSTEAQRQEIATREGIIADKIRKEMKAGNVYDYVIDPETGLIGGVTHKQSGILGSLGNKITGLLGVDDLILGDRVYTGASKFDPFGTDGGREGKDDSQKESKIKSVVDEIKPVVTATDAYYSMGVGKGTLDVSDPANIAKYLLQTTGQTPSPIGATYNATTNTYKLPDGTEIDALTGRRKKLSGLNIFKAV
jgi:hypothetical protein